MAFRNLLFVFMYFGLFGIFHSTDVAEAQAPSSRGAVGVENSFRDAATEHGVPLQGASTTVPLGWQWLHPITCNLVYSGTTPYIYVFTQEGPLVYTADWPSYVMLTAACQTGNVVAFYVVQSDGNFDKVAAYNVK